jgi:N-acetylglucosaminyldiphosphoundecaprenol N-acetyl-beta-D-mannosaminyltransferase
MGKRCFDLVVSVALLLVLSPIMAMGYVLSGWAFNRTRRLGRSLVLFDELSFNTDRGLASRLILWLHITGIPVLFNIARGEMSFVGPLPKSPTELISYDFHPHDRFSVRPGLISLWWIRRRANIDYETEYTSDIEYAQNYSFSGDIGICLRALPAFLYGDRSSTTQSIVRLLGIDLNNFTMSETVDTIMGWLHEPNSKQVCFVNADCVNIAYRDKEYMQVLKGADLRLADGIGLKLAGRIFSQNIAQNLCGTDVFPRLCEAISGTGVKLFLLGAKPEAVAGTVKWIHNHYPEVEISGFHHGYFHPEEEPAIIQRIKDSGTQLLVVALGVPKQDKWIHRHLEESGVSVAMGMGALFDFFSGRIPRAPLWVREMSMEWVYRLVQEPGRMWKRYLVGNFIFFWHVLYERFFRRNQ